METYDLRLAAFLISEQPVELSEISMGGTSDLKKIILPAAPGQDELIQAFLQKRAKVDLFGYNRALNFLRDMIRGGTR